MRNAASMTSKSRCSKRRMVTTLMAATLLAVAASMVVQPASAAAITDARFGQLDSRQVEHFENVDGLVKRASDVSPSSNVQASYISKALKLAGTYSPTVSTIAGSTVSTSTTKATSTKTTSTSTKASSSTKTSTSSKTTSTTSSSKKQTSTSINSIGATASAKSTTAKTSTKASTSTTSKADNFPQASSLSKSTSTTKAATTTTTSKAKTTTATWSWAAGAYGCGTVSPSGRALLCYATGTGTGASKRSEPTSIPLQAREMEFEYVQRAETTNVDDLKDPDLGWLDTVVGAVPYKNGDMVSSIVWVVATLMLLPLFIIRLLRRSSLIAHVLFTIFLWGVAVIAGFGIRAWLANSTATTTLMIVQNVLLQVLPCLLLEPLLSLLSMYSTQGGIKSGIPSVCLLLRTINVVALALFAVTAAYTGMYMHQWDETLMSDTTIGPRDAFPAYLPSNIARLGPIIGSFMMLGSICGGLLLVPVARGESGSMRSGGFLGFLFVLVGISVIYRILQTLHAQSTLTSQANGGDNPFADIVSSNQTSSVVATALMELANTTVVKVSEIAPPGMFSSKVSGIDWSQLQETMASRGTPQTPIIFNLIYIFPMWLEVFLLFFVHAPGNNQSKKLESA